MKSLENKIGKDHSGFHHLLDSKYFTISEFYTWSSAVLLLGMAPVSQSTQEKAALGSVESTGPADRSYQGQVPLSQVLCHEQTLWAQEVD